MTTETMSTTAQNAINDLTRPWTDVLTPKESGTGKYQPIDYPPLLDMLKDAIRSSLGKTESGRSPDAERSILNLKAFDLYDHIDGTVRAWWQELSKTRCPADLKEALTALSGVMQAAHASGQIKESHYQHMQNMFPRWKARVWELFDPPVVKELIGECPNCEASAHEDAEGKRGSALIAYYWKGLQPEAKCQVCGEHWIGEAQLLSLGRVLGASVDEDALRDMGVI